jgi:hypothetical protein
VLEPDFYYEQLDLKIGHDFGELQKRATGAGGIGGA